MNPSDLSDATIRALNLLPPGDPAISDPRLVRDSQLVEESKRSQETAAAVWLAVSPLRVAPPDVLQEVMREIRFPESNRTKTRHRSLPWLAASGWAAAAVVTIFLWPDQSPKTSRREIVKTPARFPTDVVPATTPTSRDARLRKDIVRLQDRLASFHNDPFRRTPRVMSLSAPGAVRRSEDESRQYIQNLLTNALRSALEASSGAPSDLASLVIERGWLPGGLPVPVDGGLIRHRHFPEQNWQELGLSRAANGNYYDPSSQIVWSPDPEGRGFIGKKIGENDNLDDFSQEMDQELQPPKPQALPEGFVIENPAEKTTDIFVENLPDIPAGKQLILQTTAANGTIVKIPLTPSNFGNVSGLDSLVTNFGVLNLSSRGGTTLSSNGVVTRSPGSLANTTTSEVTGTKTHSSPEENSAFTSNIVGYLYGGSLIVNFPSDSIPAEVQLAIGDISPTGTQPQIILKSEP